ncbi:hypothetical protein BMS3Bbin12_00399 [bacterium BMS3Bbin12]|nr:hypothetical protein BMS3Bbin12_00399 [bacterium BMS3Bbin12]GBE50635.1 hypothetical protein BMS3Bbin13_01575 [bacterium BMS3Bbin13]
MAAQHRLEARLEERVVGAAGQALLAEPFRCPFFRTRSGQERHQAAVALLVYAVVVVERGVEAVGQEAQRRYREGSRAAGGVYHLEGQDLLGFLGRPLRGQGVAVGGAIGTGRWIPGQRAQGALHRGHGQAGAGVEGARALARAAPAHQIPLAGENDARYELAGLAGDGLFVNELPLRCHGAAGLAGQAADRHGAARPGLGPGARDVALVFRLFLFSVSIRFGLILGGRFVFFAAFGDGALGLACRLARLLYPFPGVPLVAATRDLHLLEQVLERLVIHRLEARERQGRLVAHGEEDHRVSGGRGLELEVEQALVKDADVFARQIGEVHRRGHPSARAALAQLDLGPGHAIENLVDVPVGQDLVLEAGVFEDGECPDEAVGGRHVARGEELAAIGRDRQARMVRTLVDQAEERQDPRPGAPRAGQARAAARRRFLEFFEQAAEPIGVVVEGVVARQKLARLGKQYHHQAHHHAHRGAVDVRGLDVGALPLQCLAVAPDEDLHRFAHPLAEHLGKLGLTLAAVEHRLQERRGDAVLFRDPQGGLEEGAQGANLRRQRAFFQPEVEVPLAKGVEVEPGEDQPPLAAVGDERELLVPAPQPLEHQARGLAAAANADTLLTVDEDRKQAAARALPEVTGLDRLAGDGDAAPLGGDLGTALPPARGLGKAAHRLQYEGDEGGEVSRLVVAGIEDRGDPLAQVPLVEAGERLRRKRRHFAQARGVEEQPAVAQAVPALKFCALHASPPRPSGRRTSMQTGKTCASPDIACRLGSRCLRIRFRSLSSCSRTSS